MLFPLGLKPDEVQITATDGDLPLRNGQERTLIEFCVRDSHNVDIQHREYVQITHVKGGLSSKSVPNRS